MINWNNVYQESVNAINELIINGTSTNSPIILGEYGKNISNMTANDVKQLVNFYFNNYRLSCKNLSMEVSVDIVSMVDIFNNA